MYVGGGTATSVVDASTTAPPDEPVPASFAPPELLELDPVLPPELDDAVPDPELELPVGVAPELPVGVDPELDDGPAPDDVEPVPLDVPLPVPPAPLLLPPVTPVDPPSSNGGTPAAELQAAMTAAPPTPRRAVIPMGAKSRKRITIVEPFFRARAAGGDEAPRFVSVCLAWITARGQPECSDPSPQNRLFRSPSRDAPRSSAQFWAKIEAKFHRGV